MTGLVYLDFDLLIQRAGAGYRALVLNSPSGQAALNFSLPFSNLELENFLLRVGRPARGMRRIDSPEVEAAKSFGERMFVAVFEDEVRACLRSSLDEAHRQAAGLRIRLRLTDVPELADLPWEYLYNPTLNRFFALSVETPIVRYLDLPERIWPLAVTPPLRVLVMISDPSDYPPLDVEGEWDKLRELFGELEQRGLVTLERLDEATLAALQRRLRQGECHIFHFIGHGGFDQRAQDGVLVLEDDRRRGHNVSGQNLGTLLHDHRPMRLVVLNACEGARPSRTDPFSGTAQSLVQQGIPAVIAMQFEITDQAAITFAREIYGALADGYPVDAALAEARKAIFAQGYGLEWGTPVLYLRAPDGLIFNVERGVMQAPPEKRQKNTEELPAGLKRDEEIVAEKEIPKTGGPRRLLGGRIKDTLQGTKWGLIGATLLVMVLVIGGIMWMGGKIPKKSPPPRQIISLTVHADKRELKVRERVTLKVKGQYSDGKEGEISHGVEWSSGNLSVVRVNPEGQVEAQGGGKADITARYAGVVSMPLTLSVKAEEPKVAHSPGIQLVSLTIDADKRDLKVRDRVTLRVKGKYSDGREAEVSGGVEWQSSDRTIAAVNSSGQVEGSKEGNADITARYAGIVSPPLTLSVKKGAMKRPETEPRVKNGRIKDHIKTAKSYRERGEYSDALSELDKARAVDPTNKEVEAEVEITRKACNAEKRLGRLGIVC